MNCPVQQASERRPTFQRDFVVHPVQDRPAEGIWRGLGVFSDSPSPSSLHNYLPYQDSVQDKTSPNNHPPTKDGPSAVYRTAAGVAAPLSSDELEWPKCPESLKNSRYWHRGRATPGRHRSGHYSGALSRPNPSTIEQGQQDARSASGNGSPRVRHALGPICTALEVFLRLHACPRLDSSYLASASIPYNPSRDA